MTLKLPNSLLWKWQKKKKQPKQHLHREVYFCVCACACVCMYASLHITVMRSRAVMAWNLWVQKLFLFNQQYSLEAYNWASRVSAYENLENKFANDVPEPSGLHRYAMRAYVSIYHSSVIESQSVVLQSFIFPRISCRDQDRCVNICLIGFMLFVFLFIGSDNCENGMVTVY